MSFIGQNTLRTKQLNRTLVFQTLLRLEAPTRQEIAAFTKLTPATITNIVNELMEYGYVVELGNGVSELKRAGRKTVVLGLNEEKKRVAGVHIRSDRVELGIVTLRGKVLKSTSFDLPASIGQDEFLELLTRELESFLQKNKALPVSCIGVGSVGLVDYESGRILEAEHLGWENVAIEAVLSRSFNLPVYVDHHVRAMTLAEKMFGACKNQSDFLCVYIGQGIGSGLFLRDQLYRSETTGAGEFGHMTYQPGGTACWCGNNGCLERYASEEAVLHELNMDSITSVLEACRNGDADAVQALRSAGGKIAVVLSSFINMFHVQKIVIGGDMAREDGPLLLEIREKANADSFLARKRMVEITTTALGDQQGIIGAASIALLESIFTVSINK
ncbi:ROK family transcriptional regulator [Bacillus tianshenii]|uniref:ROK family transcriptional regulator n=1 Tax=Sutcliffiella tianshenii TaxID=1463404 RepID=UPI001CD4E676|nr:ROK family transcriptional regulator [Bacillus tianshenii]MCA1319684.1 ROK family transcriptional regulator [Bacillus tianshenii]